MESQRRISAALVALALVGAAASCAQPEAPPQPAPPAASAGPTLQFTEPAGQLLELMPGAQVQLSARLDPPSPSRVRFALLDEASGASLDASTREADAAGVATVRLRAPGQRAQFRVRASLDKGASSEVSVVVLGESDAAVEVRALYTGKRDTSAWRATLSRAAGGCGVAREPSDDDVVAEGAMPLRLDKLPPREAFELRLETKSKVVGCARVEPLSSGELRVVEISAKNTAPRPAPHLDLSMQFSPGPSWEKLLDAWEERFKAAYLGGQTKDSAGAKALLDTMLVLAKPQERPSMVTGRDAGAWDTFLTQQFGEGGGPATALGWLKGARKALLSEQAELRGDLLTSGSEASFKPLSLLHLSASDALSTKAVSWKVDVDDTLQLSSELSFWPTKLLGRTVEVDHSPAADLREATRCDKVAQILIGGPVKQSCGAKCLQLLCEAALSVMWERATNSDEINQSGASLSFTASGSAQLGDGALIDGFSGSWVGLLKDIQSAGLSTPLSGGASASRSAQLSITW